MEDHDNSPRRCCELAGHFRSIIYLNLVVPDLGVWEQGLSLHVIRIKFLSNAIVICNFATSGRIDKTL